MVDQLPVEELYKKINKCIENRIDWGLSLNEHCITKNPHEMIFHKTNGQLNFLDNSAE